MYSRWFVCACACAALGCGKKKSEDPPAAGSDTTQTTPQPKRAALGAKGGRGGEFSPSTKGFKFQNYGNEGGVENLTPAALERMFGPAVCADKDGDECLLTPAAERWMQQENDGMDGGHCEGMATVALLFQLGKLDPKTFGAPTAHELELADNRALQHEIAYWFVTQSLEPMASANVQGTPSEIVDKLIEAFESNKDSYTLGFYQPDRSGGHATTPYAVVDKGNGLSWIMHYDNNFPGEERYIEVDRKANTWKYRTAANPAEEAENYTGDATTHTLELSPTSVRTGTLACPFCGEVDAEGGAGTRGRRLITAEGDADLLIVEEGGKRIGHAGGKLVNEIAGADVIEPRAYRNSDHEPTYAIPSGKKLTVTLDGAKLAKEQTTDVSLIGPGYTLGVYDVELEPKAKDTIELSADWKEIVYKTDSDETPIIEIGISTTAADYDFEVHAAGETGGQRVRIAIDPKAGTMTVEATAKDGSASYEVEIHRIDDHKEHVFKHKGVSSGPKDRLVFHYKTWKGNGQPMDTDVDRGGDGTIDDNEDFDDEE